MSSLIVTNGIDAGRRYTLGERMRIGRAPENEIVLADNRVSRFHCEIVREGIYFTIRDLGSKNGFRVNETPSTEHRLMYGDRLQVGGTSFSFEAAKEFRTARFSNIVVMLDPLLTAPVEVHDPLALPQEDDAPGQRLVLLAGQLLDCHSDALPDVLHEILSLLLGHFEAQAGSILLRSRSDEATPLVAIADTSQLQLNSEVAQRVLVEGKAVLTAAFTGRARGEGLASRAMLMPLVRQERVFGALHVERLTGGPFTTADLSRLHLIARLVASAVRMAIQMDQIALAATPGPADHPFIGLSSQAESIRERIRRVAASESTVLLTGETGTGKELVAHAIHSASPRARRPFVAIDCASIPANLMESELFGYETGAFTGADRLKRGKVELAEGGTLLLDEIGEMQPDLQPKLLRFIEDLQFYRVGGTRPIQADVRIIAATNRNLRQAVQEGRFREDLLYRLNVMPIHLPPLRQRRQDIRPMVEFFTVRLSARLGKPCLGLVDDAWNLLEQYAWPGNVRELRHSLERALILSDDGILRTEHFQLSMPNAPASGEISSSASGSGQTLQQETPTGMQKRHGPPPSLETVEADTILRALRYVQGNRIEAAKILKIHRNTLAKKILQYGIEIE